MSDCRRISFNLHIPDENGNSILHYVLRTPVSRFKGGKFQIIELLCHGGADPFERDRLSETALHILAAQPGDENLELLQWILRGSCGGPIPFLNHQNLYGDTALVSAAVSHNVSAAKLLLEFGADPNVPDDLGDNAAQYALRGEDLEMLEVLYEFGARSPNEGMDVTIGSV